MDLAYVEKLAKDNEGAQYLLVRRDLFDRTVDAKGMKTKDSKKTVRAFLNMITKKNRPKKFWVHKGTEFTGGLKKVCSAEGIQIYSTMSETKAAFAEHTIRFLKTFTVDWNILDTITITICLNSSQTWNPEKNARQTWYQRMSRFSSFVHSVQRASTTKKRPQVKKLDTDFASRSKSYPSGRVTSHGIHMKFLKLQFLLEIFRHIQWRMSRMKVSVVNFIKKSWS